jgi:glutathione S-transferase
MSQDVQLTEEALIFRTLADAYPQEMYAAEPERFWVYFQEQCPGVSRETMEKLLEEEAA